MGATWSPDGKRIAIFDVDGMWRAANVSVVDVATGKVTKIHDSLFGPGTPTWSPDGKRVAIAMVAPYSKRFREGTNQILTMPVGGQRNRRVVRAGAQPFDRFARGMRSRLVPGWNQDGGDLRGRAGRMAGICHRASRSGRRGT